MQGKDCSCNPLAFPPSLEGRCTNATGAGCAGAANSFGERIKKVFYGNTKKPKVTYFLYDGHSLTAEANEQGEITAQYLYLNEHQPVTKLEPQGIYAIHSDHLGTPRAATNEQGETVWQADYTPFGKAQIQTQHISLNLRLPGQYEDTETGTYYNYYRYYNPDLGRYQTSDPIGLLGGLNTYAYVGSDPLNTLDPLGLEWEQAGPEAGTWFQRMLVGTYVHSMFAEYVRNHLPNSGWGANDTLNGTFGNRRPDAYNYLSNEIWELKPFSNRESGPLRDMALKQIADYLELAQRPSNEMNKISY